MAGLLPWPRSGREEDEELQVKEGNISGDGAAPFQEPSSSCRAGWRLRISSPGSLQRTTRAAGQVHGADEEENAKGKGECRLLFPEAGRRKGGEASYFMPIHLNPVTVIYILNNFLGGKHGVKPWDKICKSIQVRAKDLINQILLSFSPSGSSLIHLACDSRAIDPAWTQQLSYVTV
ncbi:hypothetical protein E5288_WYG015471 [Bos mutus]|uniref:Uncharacterized protein n=1 Tax=Bos mutus TaxID=72004 RepID=A0A6B0S3C1_9CETA|nr:hypothetical protein [Bos mutus]